jgi:hypothetical protein
LVWSLFAALTVVDIPLKAKLVHIRSDFGRRIVEVSQEAMHKLAAAHSGSRLSRAGQIDEDDFGHYFLIIDSTAQMKLLLMYFGRLL